jgi:hypothetical protein
MLGSQTAKDQSLIAIKAAFLRCQGFFLSSGISPFQSSFRKPPFFQILDKRVVENVGRLSPDTRAFLPRDRAGAHSCSCHRLARLGQVRISVGKFYTRVDNYPHVRAKHVFDRTQGVQFHCVDLYLFSAWRLYTKIRFRGSIAMPRQSPKCQTNDDGNSDRK